MKALLDLVYPRQCAGCGMRVGEAEGHLCLDCISDTTLLTPPYCEVCGEPVSGRVDHAYTCHQCATRRPCYDWARAATRYEGPVRDALHDFKYRQALWLQNDLVQLLVALYHVHLHATPIDAVIPVPLHRRRRRQRGFNQSEFLARGLSQEIMRPLLLKKLVRIGYTGSQTSLSANERVKNVRGAFTVRQEAEMEGKCILLLDDVVTTGATVSECARVLKNAGADRVVVLSVARG